MVHTCSVAILDSAQKPLLTEQGRAATISGTDDSFLPLGVHRRGARAFPRRATGPLVPSDGEQVQAACVEPAQHACSEQHIMSG